MAQNGKRPTRREKLVIIEKECCKEVMATVDMVLNTAYRIAMHKRKRRKRSSPE